MVKRLEHGFGSKGKARKMLSQRHVRLHIRVKQGRILSKASFRLDIPTLDGVSCYYSASVFVLLQIGRCSERHRMTADISTET
jgi:hypothetical protein